MAHYLPPPLLAFFQPLPPAPFKPPIFKRKMPEYSGIAQYLHRFKDPIPEPVVNKTPKQVKEYRESKKLRQYRDKLKKRIASWTPKDRTEGVTKDAYKTLFVGRLAYDVTEDDLRTEFEYYGPIAQVVLIKDPKGKSRGYGFVEFESSKDLTEAYKDADGRKIHGRRILVDVERGRTVANWLPRKLGGGLGMSRAGGRDENKKFSGREPTTEADRHRQRDREERDREERDRERRESRAARERERGDRDRDRGHDDRDRERDRDRDRDRDRGHDDRDRDYDRSYRSSRDDDYHREKDRYREDDRDRDRDRDRGRDRDRDRDRGRDRDYDYDDRDGYKKRSRSRSRSPGRR